MHRPYPAGHAFHTVPEVKQVRDKEGSFDCVAPPMGRTMPKVAQPARWLCGGGKIFLHRNFILPGKDGSRVRCTTPTKVKVPVQIASAAHSGYTVQVEACLLHFPIRNQEGGDRHAVL